MSRYAARVDDNQGEIVKALLAMGCDVQSLAELGGGVADLLVFHKTTRRLVLIEVKDGSKPPSARKLTPDQEKWHKRFPVHVVNSVDEAVELVRGCVAEPINLKLAEPAGNRAEALQELEFLLSRAKLNEIKGFLAVYDDGTHWRFVWGSSYSNAVLLSDLLHDRAMERLKE